jgi:hypothetical protein
MASAMVEADVFASTENCSTYVRADPCDEYLQVTRDLQSPEIRNNGVRPH